MSTNLDSQFDVVDLAALSLSTPEDEPVRLGDLWNDRTQLILFLRHFG